MGQTPEIAVREVIRSWEINNQRSAEAAMSLLAEQYLEDDKFPQGDNEEVSLCLSETGVTLNLVRFYGPEELKKISP
jgi:hypothetical protein